MRLVLLGKPGAGKELQGRTLAKRLGVPRIVTGALLREAVERNTGRGAQAARCLRDGTLVPDEVTVPLILERLHRSDCRSGFVLDGFPRSMSQAQLLDVALARSGLELAAALLLDVSDETSMRRMLGRRIDPVTGDVYHLEFDPPRCDEVARRLERRHDDTEAVAKERLDSFRRRTQPVVDHYTARRTIVRIDASRPLTDVTAQINESLGLT